MKIDRVVTKRGDKGSTKILSKKNIKKSDILIESIGSIDELNSFIGLAKSNLLNNKKFKNEVNQLNKIQKILFDIGAEISSLESNNKIIILTKKIVREIEETIKLNNSNLPSLDSFLVPGSGLENAAFHITRTVCRRVEVNLNKLSIFYKLNQQSLIYINRLSDLFFVFSRTASKKMKQKELKWK